MTLLVAISTTASINLIPLILQADAITLSNLILWTVTAVLIVTSGLIIYSLLRGQRTKGPQSNTAESLAGQGISHSPTVLEIIWMLIPMGILIALLILTYRAL